MSKDVFDLDKIVLQIAEKLRDKATDDGRIPFLSGDLRKSVQVEKLGYGKAAVGSNLNYARAVHDGRPAITIRPKGKKSLKFKVGGRTVFAKSVYQPARKGKPFLREAAEEVENEGYDFLDRYLEDRVSEKIWKDIKGSIKLNLKL